MGMARAAGASYRDLDNDYQHEYMTKVQPAPAECPTAKNKAKEVLEQEPQELLPEPIAESVVTEPAAMVVHANAAGRGSKALRKPETCDRGMQTSECWFASLLQAVVQQSRAARA